MTLPCATLQALGAGIVHTPADQSHSQSQENQENPILPHLGHYVPPHTSQTIWDRELKNWWFTSKPFITWFNYLLIIIIVAMPERESVGVIMGVVTRL